MEEIDRIKYVIKTICIYIWKKYISLFEDKIFRF